MIKRAPNSNNATKSAKPYSLKRRLLLVILFSSLFLWFLGVSIMVAAGFHITNNMLDSNLRDVGRLVMVTTHDLQHQRGIAPHQYQHARARLQYQIIRQGSVYSRTSDTPETPFIQDQAFSGLSSVKIDNQLWRVFVIKSNKGNFTVQIGQKMNSPIKMIILMTRHLIIPAVLWLMLLGIICFLVIRKVLKPLEHTAAAIAQKSPQDLSPIDTTGLPSELLPLTSSLNRVFIRLDKAMKSERRFTADAAHELRTPLAALRTHTQLLQRKHPNMSDALQNLAKDIDRCTRLISQLLLLARLDPTNPTDSQAMVFDTIDLDAWLPELLNLYQPQIQQRHMHLSCVCDKVTISANSELLKIALNNLIENAIHYCPEGSQIVVSARHSSRKPEEVEISVADDGNGVPQEQWERLTHRFYRVLGNQQPGSGLGLSIVQHIAELHCAKLEIGHGLNEKGLSIKLHFPLLKKAKQTH